MFYKAVFGAHNGFVANMPDGVLDPIYLSTGLEVLRLRQCEPSAGLVAFFFPLSIFVLGANDAQAIARLRAAPCYGQASSFHT